MNKYEKMCWNELVSECLEGTSPLITSCEDSILSANERIKELAEILENHRLEVELLNNKIDDLQAYKDLSIYLVNRAGFDSIESIVSYFYSVESVFNWYHKE